MATNWKHWIYIAWLCLTSLSGHAVTPMISAGSGLTAYLASDGSIWGTGSVQGYPFGATSPVRLSDVPNVIEIATGYGGTYALQADGTLWTVQYGSPAQRVQGVSQVKAISAARHVLVLRDDGTVWAWGLNEWGQLGNGTQTRSDIPVQVANLTNIIKIKASGGGSLALRSDGTVWMWGPADQGAAGDGISRSPFGQDLSDIYHLFPTRVHMENAIAISGGAGSPSLALKVDGTAWVWGQASGISGGPVLTPTPIPGLDQVVAIESQGEWAFALRSDGTVWAWGYNQQGQLGIAGGTLVATPTPVSGLSDIVAIATTRWHTAAMRRDGVVFAWGNNDYGELGDGTLQGRAEPRPVSGQGGSGQFNLLQTAPASYNKLPNAQIILDVSSGRAPMTVNASATNSMDPDGTIVSYAWSTSTGSGTMGTSSDAQHASGASATFTFAQPGTYQVTLLVEDNAGGRGFVRQRVVVEPSPVTISAVPKIQIARGDAMGLRNDGRIVIWGGDRNVNSMYDTKGLTSNLMTVPVANGITGAVDFMLGPNGGHVLLADGSVLGWGQNTFGAPGVGNATAYFISPPQLLPDLPPVQVLASNGDHRLALTRDGRVYAWGQNSSGELGLGDRANRFAPAEVTALGNNVVAIAGAVGRSMALKSDGAVWAWGNSGGCDTPNGNLPAQVPGLSNIAKIFVTPFAAFAQRADGTVWVTGGLPFTVAGDPGPCSGARHLSVFNGAIQIAGGRFSGEHLVVLKVDGTVWTGGQPQSYALGYASNEVNSGLRQVPGITGAIGITATDYNSAALLGDGTVLTWGRNDFGQIGDGTFAIRIAPVAVLNEKADGFLDLIPGTDFELPPGVGVPFFAVASGNVADLKASVNTTTKFNPADVGRSGNVYVTAAVPPGSLVPATSGMSARSVPGASAARSTSTSRTTSSAANAADTSVLVQLTPAGWQPVVDGQIIPYASGVLGDQLSTQTILNNTDTTNLKGAQFCLGYGTSAEQMIAMGTMRVVASIPDPNATGASAPSCIVAGPPVSYNLTLPPGWSLLGNSLNQSLAVATLFNDANAINSVWKWDAGTLGWQFYTPLMDAAALQSYAAGKGYGVLTEIKPGEGYWVNTKAQPTLATQSGASYALTSTALAKGWNLAATGNDITPAQFNGNLKSSLSGKGVTTLWAWDSASAKWFFYAPSLEEQGGTALSGYVASKGYLDFTAANKKLGNGTGFWVNR